MMPPRRDEIKKIERYEKPYSIGTSAVRENLSLNRAAPKFFRAASRA
jgi:hypothetical protein